jgi:hypothetical protein
MASKKRLYIGTDSGLTVMTQKGSGWDHYQDVLAGKFVRAMTSVRGKSAAYACVTREGLYATWDGGESWRLALPGNVHSVAVDPNDSQVVYAGTEPVSLFRSTDGGHSWAELRALKNQPESVKEKWWFPQYPHESHVLSIHVDGRDPRYCASVSNMAVSCAPPTTASTGRIFLKASSISTSTRSKAIRIRQVSTTPRRHAAFTAAINAAAIGCFPSAASIAATSTI